MTALVFAFYLTCVLFGRMADVTALNISSFLHFELVDTGGNVTLECFYEEGFAVMLYWYKQPLGQKPQLVSEYYKYDVGGSLLGEFENDPRFELKTAPGENHLKISHLQSSDSATYYCIKGYLYVYEFLEGVMLHVKASGSNIPALVHQSSSEIIQPGGSVTLNCTVHTGSCGGEHSVYWFKTSQEESHPGLIYTHGSRNDQCERKDDTQTHTCVYNLPMGDLNLSHAGTYYCAVASCGHVLFGDGTKLDMEDDDDSSVLVHFLSVTSAFLAVLTVLLAFSVCVMNNSCLCSESQAGTLPSSVTANIKGYQNEDLLYDNVSRENKLNKGRRQRDDTWTECVYFSVKQ